MHLKQIGILLYITNTPGVGGVLRQQIDDFYVEEVAEKIEGQDGNYLIVELTKRNWETYHLIRELSRIMRVSQNRIGWAGTKDKRAVTRQMLSIRDVTEEDVARITLKDVEIKIVGRSNKKISLGDLWGNSFRIVIRNIDLLASTVTERVESILNELRINGVPNFFGIQRFGELRPVNHLVGEAMVEGDFEKAALTYIAKSFPDEPEEIRFARDYVWNTRDFKGGLNRYPVVFRFERAMMNHLVAHEDDYTGSFRVLSRNLQKMFVHSYQSYMFNLILSRRLEYGIPINEAVIGDVVCFKNSMGLPDTGRLQKVTEDTCGGINNLIAHGRAFVTAPLIGYETEFSGGCIGEIEKEVVSELGVDLEGFRLEKMPELASGGHRREIIAPLNLSFKVTEDELNEGKTKVVLEFMLPKGDYATVVAREFMKT